MINLYILPLTPGLLDCLWAEFFVTGERKPVERITEALPVSVEKNMDLFLTASAARWSLTSLSIQYPRVLEILKEIQKEKKSVEIGEILKKVEELKSNKEK